jgi:hypothetical protein
MIQTVHVNQWHHLVLKYNLSFHMKDSTIILFSFVSINTAKAQPNMASKCPKIGNYTLKTKKSLVHLVKITCGAIVMKVLQNIKCLQFFKRIIMTTFHTDQHSLHNSKR